MSKRLAIDANLLVLLIVGQVSRSLIGKHKRLRAYSEVDFDLLTKIRTGFSSMVVTPNTSTETSNLIAYGVNGPLRMRLMAALGLFLRSAKELYQPSSVVSERGEFMRLGLTDAALLSVLDEQSVLLTDDNALFVAAVNSGRKAYLFSIVRNHAT